MERITERYELAIRALTKFHELASRQNLTEIERDALIQRFEFTFELTWKCAKEYLYIHEGIDAASPKKSSVRAGKSGSFLMKKQNRP